MKLDTYLAILQQSEYDLKYFSAWVKDHGGEKIEAKPQKMTAKLRLIKLVAQVLFFLPLLTRIKLALALLWPFEAVVRKVLAGLAMMKLAILRSTGLKVVAIAGSYAKTSTKHIIEHALKSQLEVLVTPKSINTPLGISQVILNQLKSKHKLFVVELGEYYQGDVKDLAQMVKPNFGIITPIGRQHLERMGSLEKIAQTMKELIDYFSDQKQQVLIAAENRHYYSPDLTYYGADKKNAYRVSGVEVSRRGTEFKVHVVGQEKALSVFTPLYGQHQAVNSLPSFWLADKLGLSSDEVATSLAQMPYLERRHQPTFAENEALILDNSYNTNPDSVQASLELIDQLKASKKIIITMGFVELGDQAAKIHQEFGKTLAKKVDYVGLVKAKNTDDIIKGFEAGGGNKRNLIVASTMKTALTKLHDKIIKNSIILLEGGHQELFI